jgi:hypothetical protein
LSFRPRLSTEAVGLQIGLPGHGERHLRTSSSTKVKNIIFAVWYCVEDPFLRLVSTANCSAKEYHSETGIRTQDCFTAVKRTDNLVSSHPSKDSDASLCKHELYGTTASVQVPSDGVADWSMAIGIDFETSVNSWTPIKENDPLWIVENKAKVSRSRRILKFLYMALYVCKS